MSRKKNREDSEDPKPLNFDKDEEKGFVEPFMMPEDERGDEEDSQYYEEEESLSPEEVKKRKEEGTF